MSSNRWQIKISVTATSLQVSHLYLHKKTKLAEIKAEVNEIALIHSLDLIFEKCKVQLEKWKWKRFSHITQNNWLNDQMPTSTMLQRHISKTRTNAMDSDATTTMPIRLAMEALMEEIAQVEEDDVVRQN